MIPINFTNRLLKGEKIVWSGQPSQGLLLTGQDWLLIPFSLLWWRLDFLGEQRFSNDVSGFRETVGRAVFC